VVGERNLERRINASRMSRVPIYLSQLGGMMWYEVVRHWRRRGLPVTVVLWLVVTLWASRLTNGPASFAAPAEAHAETVRQISNSIGVLLATSSISVILVVLTLGVLVAETIPLDQQLGVREWHDALPLSPAVYLGGKLLGVWAAVFLGLGAVFLLALPLLRLTIGPFDLGIFSRLWLLALTPAAFIVAGISTLLASLFASRRWAMFLGVVVAMGCYLYLVPGFTNYMQALYVGYLQSEMAAMAQLLCPADPANCPAAQMGEVGLAFESSVTLAQTLGWGAVATAISWLVAWGWQQWMEGR
jgi:hypothetical protein